MRTAPNFVDLTGQRFGRLTVVARAGNQYYKGRKLAAIWNTQCDCGNKGIRTSYTLKSGKSKSCGCWSAELSGLKRRLPPGVAGRNANKNKYTFSARKRGIFWNLTDTQFDALCQGNCTYCGIEPRQVSTASRNCKVLSKFVYNGIDRVDNTKGYEPDNCVTCCKICNRAKDTMTEQEFLDWVGRVHNHASRKIKRAIQDV